MLKSSLTSPTKTSALYGQRKLGLRILQNPPNHGNQTPTLPARPPDTDPKLEQRQRTHPSWQLHESSSHYALDRAHQRPSHQESCLLDCKACGATTTQTERWSRNTNQRKTVSTNLTQKFKHCAKTKSVGLSTRKIKSFAK